ncbi:hypothetical protein KL921_000268 [Ogataea angusta]|uniref:Uncharacterized protein n=1 Tax=Pichia angusta TaxID=870730 RepID=A0AAN6DLP6_PICAN|nr:uncharacterized protein KL928_000523 [Ogataea angusta]KAG7813994.1 hypothetical protein KL921_000268 [Ogataea angusta]KAG7822048.1 hypothetical protein KL928_000523 [Ogataea angusta]KAG7825676.1 hypothetical protein KL909_000908 [Ogataea angusta]KAG7831396.1 hypothetical protein KL920_000916 [Ogataea angusta]KAG7837339.1 hypothetical protein KL943_001378 [Ogataea angusta]
MHFIEEVVRQKATARTASTPSSAARAPNKRKRINYNIAALQNAIEQQNFDQDGEEENEESERHSAIELKKANRRFEELDRENFSEIHKMEIPKNLGPPAGKRTSTPQGRDARIQWTRDQARTRDGQKALHHLRQRQLQLVYTM